MQTHYIASIILACLFAVSGCGKSADEQAATGSGANEPTSVEVTDNHVEVTTGQGTLSMDSGEGVAVPTDFPKDIYLYEGAKVLAAMTMPKGQMLTLETADTAAKVGEEYSKAMPAAGWKQEMAMDSGAGKMFAYSRGKQQVQVTITTDEDTKKTMISLVAGSDE